MRDLRIDPQYPVCMCCHDTGLQHLDGYPPPYRFCACPAGSARQQKEPNLCDESNGLAAKLGLGVTPSH